MRTPHSTFRQRAEAFLAGDARTAGGTANRRLTWFVITFALTYVAARAILAALSGGYGG